MKIISFTFLLLFTIHHSIGQSKKPKVALVLSGGGAKGIAHIPTLQALDSLGIVPDMVIGTSMGAIVGAFYASGYSGDSIAHIAKTTNWSHLFSSKTPITSVSNEEKSEYKRYLTEFEIVEGKFRNKTSMISDQNINTFFNQVTYPVNHIKDFDNLPIPFRAVTVDIVNGKEVILDKGSLSFAMRSTMSIPAVFAPMEYKDVLLVDGGVMNNFPTDVAKAWGADIIIGSDVGGGMEPKENLSNPVNVVFQSAMLASNLKVPVNKKLCDVLIDHTTHLTYSTGSFSKNIQIYDQGKIATNNKMDALSDIANRLNKYQQKKVSLPNVPNQIIIDTIIYDGISQNNIDLFKSRVNISTNKKYSHNEINKATKNALGTNLFEGVSFHLNHYDEQMVLKIKATEKSQHLLKGALHFDDFRGVGFFINYTGRNILGNSSRVLLSADLSSDFRYRFQYQKNFGERKDWWFRSDFYGEKLDQRTYIRGNYGGDLRSEHVQFDNQINLNIDSFRNYVGIGATYDWNKIRPKVDQDVASNIYNLKRYDFKFINIFAHYTDNTLNELFYATSGTYFKVKLGTNIYNEMIVQSTDQSLLPDTNGSVSKFAKLRFNYEKRINVSKKLTTILGINGGFTYFDDVHNNDHSFETFGYGANYFLGGNITRPRNDTFALQGLQENELAVTQFTMLKFAMQYNPLNSFYFTPHVNLGSVGFGNLENYLSEYFKPDGAWVDQTETSLLTTIGLTTSYNSIIGPIDFDISWTDNLSGSRIFFGVGYYFNVSN